MAQTSYGTITISDMTDGASVVSTQQIYWLKTNSTAVVKRVDGTILPGDNDITNGWTTIIPTYVTGGTYYISTATLLNRGTSPVYSEPVIDHVLTENSYNAAEAIRKANEQELIINGLQSKIKYIWTNLNAQDYAVGTYAASGIDQVELVYGNANTYGFNSYLGHQDLKFNYNNIPLTTIGLEGLKLYSPLFTNGVITGSQVGVKLDRDGLYLYRPGTSVIDAQLDNNGLVLRHGGIISGEQRNNNFIYLSTQDFPLQEYQLTTDIAVDSSKTYYEINNYNYIEVEEPISDNLLNYYELVEAGITINNHTPSKADINLQKENDDIAWREIIGTKFGVDAEGNLYANNANLSNATVEGAITATSLTIGRGTDTYNAINAINASGYTIEIINDINAAPEETVISNNATYLYPIMYHNGVKVTDNEIIKTQYFWYEDNSNSGLQGDSENGGILAEYGHTYRVTYSFDDGEVGAAPSVQQITVDPQKYITKIADDGITIHPEDITAGSYLQITANQIDVIKNNTMIASYGTDIIIGSIYNKNTLITNNNIQFRDRTASLATFTTDYIQLGPDNMSRAIINLNGLTVYKGSDNVAEFGTTARIGASAGSRFLMNSDSLQAYNSSGTKYFEVTSNGLTWGSNTAATTSQLAEVSQTAAQTATNFIKVDGNGIKIQNSSDATDYLFIDSSKVAIYRDNVEKLQLTDSLLRLGDNTNYLFIDSSKIALYRDNVEKLQLTDSLLRLGDSINYLTIDSSKIALYKNSIEKLQLTDSLLRLGDSTNYLTIDSDSLDIYSNQTRLATFYANGAEIGENSTTATIGFNKGRGTISARDFPGASTGQYDITFGINDSGWGSNYNTLKTGLKSRKVISNTNETMARMDVSATATSASVSMQASHDQGENVITAWPSISGYTQSNGLTGAINLYIFTDANTDGMSIVTNLNSARTSRTTYIRFTGNYITLNGTTIHSSDKRLKTHIKYLEKEAIDFVSALRPAYFIFKEQKATGFYAQEVESIDPWNCFVNEDSDGYKTLNYIGLIAPLVTYCQHLEKRITELETQLEGGIN